MPHFEIAQPQWLWLLLLMVPIVYLWRTSRIPDTRLRRWTSLGLRICLVIFLVGALAEVRLAWLQHGICVAFLLDRSQSVPPEARAAVRQQIEQEVARMGREDQFFIVEFAGDALLGCLPGPKGALPAAVDLADTGRTDLARALRLALASLPADRQKRIVLFSDGNENAGDALTEARIMANADTGGKNGGGSTGGVDIQVLPMRNTVEHEIMLEQVQVPARVSKGTRFTIRTLISADQAQPGVFRLSCDGRPITSRPVQLQAGTTVVEVAHSLDDTADGGIEGGGGGGGDLHRFAATIEPIIPGNDTFSANNTAYGITQVDVPGRTLVVRGCGNERDYITPALLENRLETDATAPENLPTDLAALAGYDALVLENVSALDLSAAQMVNLRNWVKETGGGLVLVGGANSFGPGGYKDTPLEQVAPVEMDIKQNKHLATVAMVVMLDKSGSMGMLAEGAGAASGVTKMDLANQGAVETIRLLSEVDEAQIGAVDTEVKWMGAEARLLPMTSGNKALLRGNTLSNRAGGGGIYAKTALYHAYKLVTQPKVQAMTRHVILFADCQDTEQQEDCLEMATRYHNANPQVTTSVIGLGVKTDPHVPFQKELAKRGGGRWYVTNNPLALPRIFAREAFIVSRSALVEKKEGIQPALYDSPLLEGFGRVGGGFPRVYGYVGTTLKPRATLAAHGLEANDPLLAHWTIGLGKCVAFTSDATGRWGKDLVRWEGFAKFWGQTVRWASRATPNTELSTSVAVDGDGQGQTESGRVRVQANRTNGRPINNLDLTVRVAPPDSGVSGSEAAPMSLKQVGPGIYEGRFQATKRGTYMVSVIDEASQSVVDRAGGVMSYPAEFRVLKPNLGLLRTLAETTGGQVRDDLVGVFAPKPQPVPMHLPLWERLILLTAAGLVLDVAWRRLKITDWWTPRRPTPVLAGAGTTALQALQTIRNGGFAEQQQGAGLRKPQRASAPPPPLADTVKEAPSVSHPEAAPPPKPPTTPAESGSLTSRLFSAKQRAAEEVRKKEER